MAVPPAVMAVLREAQRIHAVTGGAFDVTVGGLKAWHFGEGVQQVPQAEEVARQLSLVGAQDLVPDTNAGTAFLRRRGMALDLRDCQAAHPGSGHARAAGAWHRQRHGQWRRRRAGARADARPRPGAWVCAIRAHLPNSWVLYRLQGSAVVASRATMSATSCTKGSASTSVLNPRTGWPTTGVHGVSLIASSVAQVNGLVASIMVMGADAGKGLAHQPGHLAVLIAQDNGQVWKLPAMARELGAV